MGFRTGSELTPDSHEPFFYAASYVINEFSFKIPFCRVLSAFIVLVGK